MAAVETRQPQRSKHTPMQKPMYKPWGHILRIWYPYVLAVCWFSGKPWRVFQPFSDMHDMIISLKIKF